MHNHANQMEWGKRTTAKSKIKGIQVEKQKRRDPDGRGECVHEGYTCGDLWPEVVDQVVEVGESVKLEREMGLVQHRQHPTGRAHQRRSHDCAKGDCAEFNSMATQFEKLGLGFGT